MDAFSSFRTRQLQTNRTSFLDLSSFKDSHSEFDDTDGCSDGSAAQSFLEDLHVVRKACLNQPEEQNFLAYSHYNLMHLVQFSVTLMLA